MNKKLVSFVFAALLFTLSCYSQEADGKNAPSLEVQAEEPPQEQADISVENEQQEKKKRLYFSSKDEIRTRIISVDLDYLSMGLKKQRMGTWHLLRTVYLESSCFKNMLWTFNILHRRRLVSYSVVRNVCRMLSVSERT